MTKNNKEEIITPIKDLPNKTVNKKVKQIKENKKEEKSTKPKIETKREEKVEKKENKFTMSEEKRKILSNTMMFITKFLIITLIAMSFFLNFVLSKQNSIIINDNYELKSWVEMLFSENQMLNDNNQELKNVVNSLMQENNQKQNEINSLIEENRKSKEIENKYNQILNIISN